MRNCTANACNAILTDRRNWLTNMTISSLLRLVLCMLTSLLALDILVASLRKLSLLMMTRILWTPIVGKFFYFAFLICFFNSTNFPQCFLAGPYEIRTANKELEKTQLPKNEPVNTEPLQLFVSALKPLRNSSAITRN